MANDWQSRFTADALAKVDAFIAEHPGCTRDGVEQPGQGATNRVVFVRQGETTLVCKVFWEDERKQRERFGLRHWRSTGLVPEVIWDGDPRMIVMSHVPGVFLGSAREVDGEAAWREACCEVGRAIGMLTRVALTPADRAAFEGQFYTDTPTLEAYLGRILELGCGIHARDPDFRDDFWGKSLLLIEEELPAMLAEPPMLYHQDVANLHVHRGRFAGFFDLEMCRVGCASMQLASSLGMVARGLAEWEPFREGWECATGQPLGCKERRAAVAGYHLLNWREISRYLSYDGTPGTGFAWCGPADPVKHRRAIETVEAMLGVR